MNYDHKTQVGGSHYSQGAKPQHWDLVLAYQWDYFQGQIIKYLMRWKTKHEQPEKRLEDLKKARNFLDKYIAEEERKLVAEKMACEVGSTIAKDIVSVRNSVNQPNVAMPVEGSQWPRVEGDEYWSNEGYYGDNTQLYKCRHCKSTVRTAIRPPPHGCTPRLRQAGASEGNYGTPMGTTLASGAVGSVWPSLETGESDALAP